MNKYEEITEILNPDAIAFKRLMWFFYLFVGFSILCFSTITDADLVGIRETVVVAPLFGVGSKLKIIVVGLYVMYPVFQFVVCYRLLVCFRKAKYVFRDNEEVSGEDKKRIMMRLESFWVYRVQIEKQDSTPIIDWLYGMTSVYFVPLLVYGFLVIPGIKWGYITNDWLLFAGSAGVLLSFGNLLFVPFQIDGLLSPEDEEEISTSKKGLIGGIYRQILLYKSKFNKRKLIRFIVMEPFSVVLSIVVVFVLSLGLKIMEAPNLGNQSLMDSCDPAMHLKIWKEFEEGKTRISEIKFIKENCKGKWFEGYDFSGVALPNVVAHNCYFFKTKFIGTRGYRTDFRATAFVNTNMRGSNWVLSDFSYAHFKNVRFDYVNLTNADLTKVKIWEPFVSVEGTNIYGAKMSEYLRCWFEENGAVNMPHDEYILWRKDQLNAQANLHLNEWRN